MYRLQVEQTNKSFVGIPAVKHLAGVAAPLREFRPVQPCWCWHSCERRELDVRSVFGHGSRTTDELCEYLRS
jgi:hypothetical protein